MVKIYNIKKVNYKIRQIKVENDKDNGIKMKWENRFRIKMNVEQNNGLRKLSLVLTSKTRYRA